MQLTMENQLDLFLTPLGEPSKNYVELSPFYADNTLRVRSTTVDRCIKEKLDLVVCNQNDLTKCCVLNAFELSFDMLNLTTNTYHNIVEGAYTIFTFSSKNQKETKTILSKQDVTMLKYFQPSWFNRLREYFNNSDFFSKLRTIKEERSTVKIYPESKDMFRVFKETSFNNTRAIILGMDPYSNGMATGIPFATNDNKMSVSLKYWQTALGKPITDTSLAAVMRQGLLLLNVSYTVQEKISNSHIRYWEDFTTEVMINLGSLEQKKLFILMGKQARSFRPFIGQHHEVIECEHPAAAAYEKREWKHNDSMTKLDEYFRVVYSVNLMW